MQKCVIVSTNLGLDALNKQLDKGWYVCFTSPIDRENLLVVLQSPTPDVIVVPAVKKKKKRATRRETAGPY